MEGEQNMAPIPDEPAPEEPNRREQEPLERTLPKKSPAPKSHIWEARKLLRAARSGAFGTLIDGFPFATLVTPATAADLSVLVLLSTLAEHTRHLQSDPRCSVLVLGAPEGVNPQTAPRVTITGLAEIEPDPGLKARWLAVHPYGAQYADFGDFALWRIRPVQGLFVGGFGRASRMRQAEFLPDAAAVAEIAAAADDILVHCNRDHPETLQAIAHHAGGGADGPPWRMVGVDVDGTDLASGAQVLRVAWSAPVSHAGNVRTELVRLAGAARAAG
jgi:putative heme iron utilization protein